MAQWKLKVGLVLLGALLGIWATYPGSATLLAQKADKEAVAPANRDKTPEEKQPDVPIGPPGFPYSYPTPSPVEPIPPFADKNFKFGVVARIKNVDTANNRITLFMGTDERIVELASDYRLYRLDMEKCAELAKTELTKQTAEEPCQVTFEPRDGQDKVTQIYVLSGVGFEKNVGREKRLRQLSYEWNRAIANRSATSLTTEDVARGRKIIKDCERRLVHCGVDTTATNLRFHTRGEVKNTELEKKRVTLVSGHHDQTFEVVDDVEVSVVTIPLPRPSWLKSYHVAVGESVFCPEWADKLYSRNAADDKLARVRPGSQVYVTLDTQNRVTQIDIMEREQLPPLIMPDLPWLPLSRE